MPAGANALAGGFCLLPLFGQPVRTFPSPSLGMTERGILDLLSEIHRGRRRTLNVDLYVRLIRRRAMDFDTLTWQEDSDWTYIASWTRDVAMSTDAGEGVTTWNLYLT